MGGMVHSGLTASIPGGSVAGGAGHAAWETGKCRVPMWMGGSPFGFCGEAANGPQLPMEVLFWARAWRTQDRPYCHGPCCPNHGGPRDGEPILFADGTDERGHRMWCAVMPDFENLQDSPAGFDTNGNRAIEKLRVAIAKATDTSTSATSKLDGYEAEGGVNQASLPPQSEGAL